MNIKKLKRIASSRINLFQKMSIGIIAIVTSLMLILTGCFYWYFKVQAEKSVMSSLEQVSANNAQNVSSIFDRVELAVEALGTSNSGLQKQLMLYSGNPESCITAFQSAQQLLGNYIDMALKSVTDKYHVSFFVNSKYSLSEQLSQPRLNNQALDGATWLYSDKSVQNQSWFRQIVQNPNKSQWFTMGDDKDKIYMARYLQYVTVSGIRVETVTLGVVLIGLDVSWIGKNVDFSALTDDAQFLLIDDSGNVLYSQNADWQEHNYEEITDVAWASTGPKPQILQFNGQSYTVESKHFSQNMSLVTLIPSINLMKSSLQMLWALGIIAPLCLLISCLLVVAFSHRIIDPILHLARHMRLKTLAPMKPLPKKHADDDIQVLYQSYNDLVDRVHRSIQDMQQAMQREKISELNVLQAQINPHFLCNSLNSVCCLAMMHGETVIANAVSELTSFLRYNISAPNIDVPLQRELQMIKSYVAVQNFLCGDKVFIDFDVHGNAEQTIIPKMLLQPLVENCIKYGMNNGIVEIVISFPEPESDLIIVVEDNGRGSNVDVINQSLLMEVDETLSGHGYGIRNVHQRIQMKYGENYGLNYTHTEEGGTAVSIRLPGLKAV